MASIPIQSWVTEPREAQSPAGSPSQGVGGWTSPQAAPFSPVAQWQPSTTQFRWVFNKGIHLQYCISFLNNSKCSFLFCCEFH